MTCYLKFSFTVESSWFNILSTIDIWLVTPLLLSSLLNILDIFSLDMFSLEFRLIGVSYSDLRSLERKINFLPISCFSSIPFLMKIFNISISNVLPTPLPWCSALSSKNLVERQRERCHKNFSLHHGFF